MEKEVSHPQRPRDPYLLMDSAELRRLLATAAKLWLAHDGLWFQAVEHRHGLEAAMDADRAAWHHFAPLEARRIMDHLGMEPGGGLPALERALGYRLYSHLNEQETEWPEKDRLIFRMKTCRVQSARQRRGLPDFPCRSVGIVEYSRFAEAVDPRIVTHCISCPPDRRSREVACAWEFTLTEEAPSDRTTPGD